MRLASFQIESDRPRSSLRRRGSAFLLALAVEALIVLALITVAWRPPSLPKPKPEPNTFNLMPPPPKKKIVPDKKARSGGHLRSDVVEIRPPAPIVPPVLSKPPPDPMLNAKELFDAADISKMHGDPSNAKTKTYGPGEGSGGQDLEEADWYPRPPIPAELSPYLKGKDIPSGSWATISCKLIADYHVENCRSLGESPVGSGLARALRLAAWQFRVRSRAGKRLIIGDQVAIHFSWTVIKAKAKGAAPDPDPDSEADAQ